VSASVASASGAVATPTRVLILSAYIRFSTIQTRSETYQQVVEAVPCFPQTQTIDCDDANVAAVYSAPPGTAGQHPEGIERRQQVQYLAFVARGSQVSVAVESYRH
jgi:hypothetical protein